MTAIRLGFSMVMVGRIIGQGICNSNTYPHPWVSTLFLWRTSFIMGGHHDDKCQYALSPVRRQAII